MSEFDKLTERLTRRLRIDPELRLDVANELRAHLDDTAADFRQAGMTDEQADAEATRGLGNEKQLTALLWEANRGRIRIRQAAKWTARLALIPAAVIVILAVAMGVGGRFPFSDSSGLSPFPSDDPFDLRYQSFLKGLSADDLYILCGDPNARDRLDGAKSISDRWPNDPVYYGNYVVQRMADSGLYGRDRQVDPNRFPEMLAVMDRGEQIDPDNGFYNFHKASWLIQAAATVSEDPNRTYERVDRDGETKTRHCWQIEIHDRELFDRGLAESRRGITKPHFTSRTLEMMQRRLDILPKPRRLREYLARLTMQVSTLLPSLNDHRKLEKAISAHAISLAEAGRGEQAVRLVTSAEQMGGQLADAACLIELLVGQAVYTNSLAHAEQVHKILGQTEKAKAARAEFENTTSIFYDAYGRGNYRSVDGQAMLRARGGMLWSTLMPGFFDSEIDFEPIRSAEQTVAMEAALLAILVLMVLLTLLLVVITGCSFVGQRLRRKAMPVGVFVGWRRIGKIVLPAIVLPLAAYGCYAYFLMFGDRGYSLNYAGGRIALELAITFAAVYMLLIGLSYSAIRERSEALGLCVPSALRLRDRRWMGLLGILVAIGAAVYLIGWWAGPFRPKAPRFKYSAEGFFVAAAVIGYAVLWQLREFIAVVKKGYLGFRQTLYRSLVPILAAAVIVIGLLCGGALAWAEISAVGRIEGSASFNFSQELERSTFRPIQERFVELNRSLAAE